MRRVSLALSLSVAAALRRHVGAQDPEHAPPPRGATQTPAAAPRRTANAPAQPPGRGRGDAPAAAGGRGRGAASTRRPSPAPNRCSNPSAASAMATTRAGGPADRIWPGRWSSLPTPAVRRWPAFSATGRPERGMPAFPGLTDQQISRHRRVPPRAARSGAQPRRDRHDGVARGRRQRQAPRTSTGPAAARPVIPSPATSPASARSTTRRRSRAGS